MNTWTKTTNGYEIHHTDATLTVHQFTSGGWGWIINWQNGTSLVSGQVIDVPYTSLHEAKQVCTAYYLLERIAA